MQFFSLLNIKSSYKLKKQNSVYSKKSCKQVCNVRVTHDLSKAVKNTFIPELRLFKTLTNVDYNCIEISNR